MPHDSIPAGEFAKRRQRVFDEIGDSIAIIGSGEGGHHFKADANFVYLTGIENESGAFILFDRGNPQPERRSVLFLRPQNPEVDRWDGLRPTIDGKLKTATGFPTIMRTPSLPAVATAALRRQKQASCLMPFAVYPSPVSADLNVFQQVAQRVPGVRIEDKTGLLMSMRAAKSPAEIDLIKKAADITLKAYEQTVPKIKPGVNERDVQFSLESVYMGLGGGIAYNSIVGAGINGTVLHYNANNQEMKAGDLVVIDSAASYKGYASDVTRTYPVGGKFTSEQRDVYEIVLAALLTAIKSTKPGIRPSDFDAVARNVIDKAGYGDYFIHGAGHPLGLVVHDVVPDHPLKAGAVVTIEPGIYLPEQGFGVRIEDDLVLTRTGNVNITERIPKTVKEIEALMK
ncbi:MAG: Xaa-Pro peptidase family protein [Tepidisphaeraceae bacterium]